MELYEAIAKRRIVRDFKDADVPLATVEKIIGAGLKAPTHDHLRNWEFVVLHGKEEKERALRHVAEGIGPTLDILKRTLTDGTPQQKMYAAAMPRQYTMLFNAPYVVMPFFKATPGVMKPDSVSSLNPLSSIWCVVENIFLARARLFDAHPSRQRRAERGARGGRARRLHAPVLHRPRRPRGRRAGNRAD